MREGNVKKIREVETINERKKARITESEGRDGFERVEEV